MRRYLAGSFALMLASSLASRVMAADRSLTLTFADMTIQPDDKLLGVGYTYRCRNDGTTLGPLTMAAARFSADGRLDHSFGDGGFLPILPANGMNFAYALARDDGRYWLAQMDVNTNAVTLSRLQADGSPDRAFAPKVIYQRPAPPSSGTTTTDTEGAFAAAAANTGAAPAIGGVQPKLLHRPGGKALLVVPATYDSMTLVMIDANGNRDQTFGSGGVLEMAPDNIIYVSQSSAINLPDGKILGALTELVVAPGGSYTFQTIISRFDEQGHLDASYGKQGSLMIRKRVSVLLPLTGDHLLATIGEINSTSTDLAVITPGGDVDLTVGKNGHIPLPNPDPANLSTTAISAAQQADGKILVWAQAAFKNSDTTKTIPYLIRYLPDFTIDPSFAHVGSVARNLMPNRDDAPVSLGVDREGRIITVSMPNDDRCNPQVPFLVTRSLSDGSLDPDFGLAGVALP